MSLSNVLFPLSLSAGGMRAVYAERCLLPGIARFAERGLASTDCPSPPAIFHRRQLVASGRSMGQLSAEETEAACGGEQADSDAAHCRMLHVRCASADNWAGHVLNSLRRR